MKLSHQRFCAMGTRVNCRLYEAAGDQHVAEIGIDNHCPTASCFGVDTLTDHPSERLNLKLRREKTAQSRVKR